MANKIGAKIVLEGEAEYRKALKNINAEQKELRSEMKLAVSEFGKQQDSVEALSKKQEILSKQYQVQVDKVEIYTKAVEESARKQDEAEEKVNSLKVALAKASEEYDAMASDTETSNEALEEQQKIVDELKQKLSLAEDGYRKAQNSTANWKTSLNNAQVELNNLNSDLEENRDALRKAQLSTDDNADAIREYSQEVDEASEKTSVFGDVLKANLASDIIREGVNAIVDDIKTISQSTVTLGSTFEASMSQVAATMGMTAEEIANGSKDYQILQTAAEECGASTKYSASQAAEALNYLVLAGYDATKSAETLPKVLDLAAAGGLDLAYASDLVTDAMAALEMETSELDTYIDQMAKTSQKSNTSVAQLGEATLVCAGTVSMANQPLEIMNAELGVLANNGIKGAEGGTHLRNVILSLVSPTDKGAIALNRLGVQVADSSGQIRSLNDIMVDLNRALDGMSAVEKSNIISTIFNKTDIAAVNALLKGTGDEFNNLYAQINSCDGAAKDMADTMSDNLTGKLTILDSALEGLAITAYDKIEGTLKDSVDAATDSVGDLQRSLESGKLGKSMDDFAEALDEAAAGAIDFAEDALPALIDGLTWVMDNSDLVISGITGIASATIYHGTVAPMIISAMEAWKAYKVANEGATVAQWALNGAMNANPAGLIVTAIVGLTAALTTYAVKTASAKTETELFAEEISESNQLIRDSIQAREDAQKSEEVELILITRMKNELLELNEQESLTNEEKTKMHMLVNQLNEALPELNLAIDEESGYLAETNDELESYISNMEEMLRIQFIQEDLEEVYRELYDAQTDLLKIQNEYEESKRAGIKIQEDWNQAHAEGKEALDAYNASMGGDAMEVMDKYIGKCLELEPTLNESQALVDQLSEEYEELKLRLDEATTAQEEIQQSMETSKEVLVGYKGEIYTVSSEVASSVQNITNAYATAYDEAVKSFEGQIGLFEELSLASDTTAEVMATNLGTQAEVLSTYKDDMLKAVDLVEQGIMDSGLLTSIQELGIDGAAYLHELVTAAENDTDAFNSVMQEWAAMTEAKEGLIETLADISSNYSEKMEELLGIQEEKGTSIENEVLVTSENIQENVETALEELVTTTDTSLDEMVLCVSEKAPEIKQAAQNLCTATIEGANEALLISDDGTSMSFVAIGYSMPQGIAQGIIEGQDLIKDALQGAVDHAINSIDMSGITAKINRELGDLYE